MAESQLEESMHLQIFLSPRLGRKTPMRVGYSSPFLEAEDTKAPIYSSLPHLNLTCGFSFLSALQIYEPFFFTCWYIFADQISSRSFVLRRINLRFFAVNLI